LQNVTYYVITSYKYFLGHHIWHHIGVLLYDVMRSINKIVKFPTKQLLI